MITITSITNHDINTDVWLNQFSRDELRAIAARYSIKRGRDKVDTAINIKSGIKQDETIATFEVVLSIPSF